MTNSEFLKMIGEFARNDMVQTGVLASLTIAQAILESGWGKSDLAVSGQNLFGMKASSSWVGRVYSSQTKECYDGVNLVSTIGSFKAYDDWGESVADHSALFVNSSRYEKVVGEMDYKTACYEVKKAGYATDPTYSEKLIGLIEQYRLYEYDVASENTSCGEIYVQLGEEGMGNSGLICGTIFSPNKSVRTGKISKIAIHCMAGNLSAESCGNLFSKSSVGASSHYGIGSDGKIYLYVNECDRAWCTGGTKTFHGKKGSEIDQIAVTIEVANIEAKEPWKVSDVAYGKLLDLVEDVARRNGMSEVTYASDGSGTLQAHRWYAAKACPGDYLMERFPEIASIVTERLGGLMPTPSPTPTPTPTPVPSGEYRVRVTDSALNIRSGSGVSFPVVGVICDCGVYTIMEDSGNWGRLKSGAGWICLAYTERVL